ncbi:MAG: hypothetical protein QG604_114 [Candidatus Dependentiae bacterium]|nr:hypothetical protein [Candidatus Dependentiae bacterium]
MKKKIIHGLLALAALNSTTVLADFANKTFMNDRGSLSNNVLMARNVCGRNSKKKDAVGANVSVAAYYSQSYNHTNLAKYFGDGTNVTPTGLIDVSLDAAATTGLQSGMIDPQSTASSRADIALAMHGDVALNPRRIEAGAQIQWNQCLHKLVDGAWMSVAAPVVYVRTEMRPTYTSTANATSSAAKGMGKGLADYFGGESLGKTVLAAVAFTQDALAKQVITPTYNSVTQVADVNVTLGYDFLREKSYKVGASIHGLIPTGNKEAGLVAMEPIAGNRSFFFGAGLHTRFNLWKSEDKSSSFKMHASAKYSYGFGADQVRTLGLTNVTTGVVPVAQYGLVGDIGTSHYMPLANVSTLTVSVEPRSRLEAIAGFCYRFNRFTANVAYNLFYAQAETLKLKGTFDETNYARVLSTGVVTASASAFAVDAYTTQGGLILATSPIVTNALDLTACTTPAQVVHKVGGDLAYSFDSKLPIRIAAGGSVDFNSSNTSFTSWTVFGKVGFSF